jgi:hypothetical protein
LTIKVVYDGDVRETTLDKQWAELMELVRKEAELEKEDKHPRLSALISSQLDQYARDLGFSEERIRRREFRAEREGEHIIRIITD